MLWSRLEAPARVSAIADVELLEATRRVSLKAGHSLAELEAALAGIIPTPAPG